MANEHVQWFKDQFDKMLLAVLILFTVLMIFHATHHAPDSSLVSWLEGLTSGYSGALLILITGKKSGGTVIDSQNVNQK